MTTFETLRTINVNEHAEKKNGLTYLSWAWAWDEVKSRFPDTRYTIHENADGWNYFTDGRTCWVKTSVTIPDDQGAPETHSLTLPVMDFKNNSIPLEKVTSFDVNKAIMRCLTKNLAMFGLGLYIYAGEDLPDDGSEEPTPSKKPQNAPQRTKASSEVKDTTETTKTQQSEPTSQIRAQDTNDKVLDARLKTLESLIADTDASIDAIINWAQKKTHKGLGVMTDEEFKSITDAITARKQEKHE